MAWESCFWREGRNLEESFVVMYVYVSSGGIFRIVSAKVQELILTEYIIIVL